MEGVLPFWDKSCSGRVVVFIDSETEVEVKPEMPSLPATEAVWDDGSGCSPSSQ